MSYEIFSIIFKSLHLSSTKETKASLWIETLKNVVRGLQLYERIIKFKNACKAIF